MYKVVKNIGIPARLNSVQYMYPVDDLEIGDGFDVPDDMGVYPAGGSKRMSSIRNAFVRKGRAIPGWKGKVRLIPGTQTLRAVRVA